MAPEVVPVLYVLEIQGVKNYFLVEIATAYKLCIYQLLSFKLKIFLFATVYLTKLILQLPSLPAF